MGLESQEVELQRGSSRPAWGWEVRLRPKKSQRPERCTETPDRCGAGQPDRCGAGHARVGADAEVVTVKGTFIGLQLSSME